MDLVDKIYFKDFLKFIQKEFNNGFGEELYDFFKSIDTKDDGFITVESLMNVMSKLGEDITIDEAATMLTEADLDNDGVVNYEGLQFCL